MAPTSMAVAGQLRQIVYYHLDNISYDNALFYAERLLAHDPRSHESAHLLALCYFRLGDYRSSYEYSKAFGYRGLHLGCAYIFAQSCLALERYKEGITALEKSRTLWSKRSHFGKHTAISRSQHPDLASASALLGKLYRGYQDKKKAASSFEDALKANPFMWDAFVALCDMGIPVRPPNSIFKLNDSFLEGTVPDYPVGILTEQKDGSAINPIEPRKPPSRSTVVESHDPFEHRSIPGNDPLNSGENDFMSKINAARSRIASANIDPVTEVIETPTAANYDNALRGVGHQSEAPQAPGRRLRNPPAADATFADAPLKIGGYRLGAKRAQRAQERTLEDVPHETNPPPVRASASTATGVERKRTVSGHPVQPRQASDEPGAPQRRSARINMFRGTNAKANAGASATSSTATRELKRARPPIPRLVRPTSTSTGVGRVVSGNRKPMEENNMDVDHAEAPRVKEALAQPLAPKTVEPDVAKTEEALKYLLELQKKFGAGYLALSRYRCVEAVAAFQSLPRAQQEMPWVLSQLGRAYYEQAAYSEAEKYYRKLRAVAPTRFDDMEIYSTILWFLKREIDLSFLAHELVDASWYSPQAWCALGNAWSLARDREQALRCFKRATQLNPKFAYAFTLQGHEHVANEEFDKALTAYRQAISVDRRHYNAYYGIGRVYERIGSYDKAHSHYLLAHQINENNAVLICCIGNVLEKQRQIVQALQYFTKAAELAPNAAQTLYKKARALLALNQLSAAQVELEKLKDLAPDEATVHFLLGKLYKMLNNKSDAVKYFTIALNLDPKASGQIKEAIESLEDEEDFDDSMMT